MSDANLRHLLHVFPTFEVGGSQRRFAQLARLHGRRYRHTVISIDGDLGMAGRLPGEVRSTAFAETFKTKSPVEGAFAPGARCAHISARCARHL